jgi:3-dehydroquinate dehydratase II
VKLALLNGPNLNLLGSREPAIYGRTTLTEIETQLHELAASQGVSLECAQRNGEGELIDQLHAWRGRIDGVLVNAGAYSHTSLALRDALVGCALPFIEVHLTNVYAREQERRHSMLAPAAIGVICGFGAHGYALALHAMIQWVRSRE